MALGSMYGLKDLAILGSGGLGQREYLVSPAVRHPKVVVPAKSNTIQTTIRVMHWKGRLQCAILAQKINTLPCIFTSRSHSYEALAAHRQSAVRTIIPPVLDDPWTMLSKLLPVSERVVHLQVELWPGGGVKGGNIHRHIHSKVTSSRRKETEGSVGIAVSHQ